MRTIRRRTFAVGLASLVTLAACGSGEPEGGPVTLRYAWWGNADRAARVERVIDLFERSHPGIRVQGTYADYDAYWQKLTTQAAGGGAADVVQIDFSYLRQYADRKILLDLSPYVGRELRTDDLLDGLKGTGDVNGVTFGIPVSANTYAVIYDRKAFAAAGAADPAKGWTWEQFRAATEAVAARGGPAGSGMYLGQMYVLQAQLRQQGREFFTPEGGLGFRADELAAFWAPMRPLQDAGVLASPARMTQVQPLTPIAAKLTATEFNWDNTLNASVKTSKSDLGLAPMPRDPGLPSPQYLKPSQLVGGFSGTRYPAQVAQFINFMINDPEAGRAMGGDRGLPPTNAQRKVAQLGATDRIVESFEDGIELGAIAPAPPAGAGTIELDFRRFAEEVSYGRSTPAEAAEEFVAEAESVLGR